MWTTVFRLCQSIRLVWKNCSLQDFRLHPAGMRSVCLTPFVRNFCGIDHNMLFKITDKHFQGADGVDWQCLGKELWLAPSHPTPRPAPSIRIDNFSLEVDEFQLPTWCFITHEYFSVFCLQSSTFSCVNHYTTVKKLMLIYFCSVLRPHSGFASCPIVLFMWIQSIAESHYILFSSSFDLEKFCSFFLGF